VPTSSAVFILSAGTGRFKRINPRAAQRQHHFRDEDV
jgi:hypothetical protein